MEPSSGILVDEGVWQAAALVGQVLRDTDELRAVTTGLDDGEWNGVYRARPEPGTAPASLVARATALFAGRPFTWHLGSDSDPAVEAALANLPFEEQEPGMVATLDDRCATLPTAPAGVQLAAVATDEQLRTWVEVLAGGPGHEQLAVVRGPAALGGPASPSAPVPAPAPAPTPARAHVAAPHVLALLDGHPVGCAAVFLTGVGAVVDHVTTARTARNRGIGTLLTRWALATAYRRGQRVALLTASPQAQGIYERLGFRTVSVVRRYRSAEPGTTRTPH
jgi:ribosomal protein S18 acetylase RimI-like enzyme